MPAKDLKLTVYSLASLLALLLGLEAVLRLAGFQARLPPFRLPSPPCMVLGSCGEGNRGLFEKKGSLLALRPEYYGWFQEQEFPARKPADEFRVFILGGSTIYNLFGQMTNSFDASGRKVRVVNLGGNSFGTARLLPVLSEILGYEPDLVLVYSGHSEFVDITIVNQFLETSPFRKKLGELLRRSRVCGLIELGVYKTGMGLMRVRKRHDNGVVRYFGTRLRPGTEKEKVYGLYRKYLAEMAKQARARGVPLVLSTVGYNRVIAPLVPEEARALHRTGLDLLRGGKYKEALTALNKAQDAEKIPFGANETTNAIVREIAAGYKVPLLDADGAIAARAPNGIPGAETFFDQCHFNDSAFLGELFRKEINSAIAGSK
ncbi:MAG TPA: hypothetical protein DCZ92_07430 [Elusimicrobia bacterium]|nr:MAG: hypothetical protein A2016_03785 [Elusimicrobia bacterium GWF2_62_30]HBA60638.1 hypothetical protein [Elusimicrobiota bacterium]